MTTTEPVNVVWGVQWEVFVMPAEFAGSLPIAPPPMGDEPTEEEQQAWQDYLEANAAFEAQMVTLAGDEDNWSPTVAVMDEEQARNSLPMLREANQGNPFNRNFQLVQAVEPVWTVVEA